MANRWYNNTIKRKGVRANMSGVIKVLTGILGVLAVIACLATVGIIGYSLTGAGNKETTKNTDNQTTEQQVTAVPTTAPTTDPGQNTEPTIAPTSIPAAADGHVHDYKQTVEKKATCYSAGKIKYVCECGDEYYVDIMSTGHVADDWEVVTKPTADKDGLRVKKCIYCDEIVAQEVIPYGTSSSTDGSSDSTGDTTNQKHVHQYTAETVREPSCILAGLRKYTCSCGSFYTEMIPAPGHVATDWTVAVEPTSTQMGTEQRTCKVCGVVLDSRPLNKVSASPAASAQASASAQPSATAQASAQPSASASAQPTASASSSASAAPSASAHVHQYTSYVLKEANCTEKGIISYVCACGSSYADNLELDPNRHSYRSVVIPATQTTQGYTIYTCIRCNYSYFDNFTPALGVGN